MQSVHYDKYLKSNEFNNYQIEMLEWARFLLSTTYDKFVKNIYTQN